MLVDDDGGNGIGSAVRVEPGGRHEVEGIVRFDEDGADMNLDAGIEELTERAGSVLDEFRLDRGRLLSLARLADCQAVGLRPDDQRAPCPDKIGTVGGKVLLDRLWDELHLAPVDLIEVDVGVEPRVAVLSTGPDLEPPGHADAGELGSYAETAHAGAIVVPGGEAHLKGMVEAIPVHAVAVVTDGQTVHDLRPPLVIADGPLLREEAEANSVGVGLNAVVEHLADSTAVIVARRPERQEGLVGEDEFDAIGRGGSSGARTSFRLDRVLGCRSGHRYAPFPPGRCPEKTVTGWRRHANTARAYHRIPATGDEPGSRWTKERQSSRERGSPKKANLHGPIQSMDESRLSRLITLPASPIGQHRVHHMSHPHYRNNAALVNRSAAFLRGILGVWPIPLCAACQRMSLLGRERDGRVPAGRNGWKPRKSQTQATPVGRPNARSARVGFRRSRTSSSWCWMSSFAAPRGRQQRCCETP